MKVTIYGATGPTGVEVVNLALAHGWQVTAAVRDRAPLTASERLAFVEGNVLTPDKALEAIEGSDAVISLLGFRRRLGGPADTTLYSTSAKVITEAMMECNVERLVYTTSAGVEQDDPSELWPYRHIVKPLWLDGTYRDMRAAEAIIRDTSLDWTLVRPGRLTDGPETGRMVVSPRFRPKHANSVSRGDLAAFIIDAVVTDSWLRGTPTLGTPRA